MALRNTLGTGKGLAGHSGNKIYAPRYTYNKVLAHLSNHMRVWVGCYIKNWWNLHAETP